MNQQDIQKILTILNPVWPPNGLDKAAVPAWTLALQDQDSALLQAAAAEWLRTQKWMPRPYELIALAADIEHQQPRQALPAPQREEQRPSEEYIRRVHAKCQAMGVNNPTINRWMAELESERAA